MCDGCSTEKDGHSKACSFRVAVRSHGQRLASLSRGLARRQKGQKRGPCSLCEYAVLDAMETQESHGCVLDCSFACDGYLVELCASYIRIRILDSTGKSAGDEQSDDEVGSDHAIYVAVAPISQRTRVDGGHRICSRGNKDQGGDGDGSGRKCYCCD